MRCAISSCYSESICRRWCRASERLQLHVVCGIRPDAVRPDAEGSIRPCRIGLSYYRCCAVYIADRQRTTCGVGSTVFGHSTCRTPCKSRCIVHSRQCHNNIVRCAISSCDCESICRRGRRASKHLQLRIVCRIRPDAVCSDAECPVRPCRINLSCYCCCTVHIADRQRASCSITAALFGHTACAAPGESRSIVHACQCQHDIVRCAISGCYNKSICRRWRRASKRLQLRIVCRIRPDAVRTDAECSVRPCRIGLGGYRCCTVYIADRQRTTCGVGSTVFGHSAC